MVDIEARINAGKAVGIPRRLWVMKHRPGMMGTRHYTKQRKYRSIVKCPCFVHYGEMTSHGTKYEDTGAIERWKKSLKEDGAHLVK
jgi:hypothetical protein